MHRILSHRDSWKQQDEDWWLDLYVMLSRATRLEDILLARAPPSTFLLQGPPKSLKQQLLTFASCTEACRQHALELAVELGFDEFLHRSDDSVVFGKNIV